MTLRVIAFRRNSQILLIALVLALVSAGLSTAVARAHGTDLLRSDPLPGVVLDAAPTQVRAWFGGELNAARSNLQVFNADRARVDKNDTDEASMVVSLPPLPPGVYSVQWTAVATDGDSGIGKFRFTVAAPGLAPTGTPTEAPAPSLTPAPTRTAAPTRTPTPESAPVEDGGGAPIVLIVAVSGVALLAAIAIVRRSR